MKMVAKNIKISVIVMFPGSNRIMEKEHIISGYSAIDYPVREQIKIRDVDNKLHYYPTVNTIINTL